MGNEESKSGEGQPVSNTELQKDNTGIEAKTLEQKVEQLHDQLSNFVVSSIQKASEPPDRSDTSKQPTGVQKKVEDLHDNVSNFFIGIVNNIETTVKRSQASPVEIVNLPLNPDDTTLGNSQNAPESLRVTNVEKFDAQKLRIILIGAAKVGKTQLLSQLFSRTYSSDYNPTMGADVTFKEVTTDKGVAALQLWDTSGSDRFETLKAKLYKGVVLTVLVYDVSNRPSFEILNKYSASFKEVTAVKEDHPWVVMANKVDVDPEEREVSKAEGEEYCKQMGFVYTETSARDNIGIHEAFLIVAKLALDRFEKSKNDTKKL